MKSTQAITLTYVVQIDDPDGLEKACKQYCTDGKWKDLLQEMLAAVASDVASGDFRGTICLVRSAVDGSEPQATRLAWIGKEWVVVTNDEYSDEILFETGWSSAEPAEMLVEE